MSGRDYLSEVLKTQKKDTTIVGTITSENTMGYMKEFHGIDEKTIKAVYSGEAALSNDLIAIAGDMLKKDKSADAIKVSAALTNKKRSVVQVVREKEIRNPQTGEVSSAPAIRVTHRVRAYMDKTIVDSVVAELKKK